MFSEPTEKKACSFERIYFSRGSDAAIYRERKQLGRLLCPQILDAVDMILRTPYSLTSLTLPRLLFMAW
jgi:glutamine phosphoribosylpyrophosphate amidotransferase